MENLTNDGQKSIGDLPPEMITKILNCLDIKSLLAMKGTCRGFYHLLQDNDWIWRGRCLQLRTLCPSEIDDDQRKGYSWQEIVTRNYSKCITKKKWLDGAFSNIDSYGQLPPNSMCPLSAESWGDILDAELTREAQRRT